MKKRDLEDVIRELKGYWYKVVKIENKDLLDDYLYKVEVNENTYFIISYIDGSCRTKIYIEKNIIKSDSVNKILVFNDKVKFWIGEYSVIELFKE